MRLVPHAGVFDEELRGRISLGEEEQASGQQQLTDMAGQRCRQETIGTRLASKRKREKEGKETMTPFKILGPQQHVIASQLHSMTRRPPALTRIFLF